MDIFALQALLCGVVTGFLICFTGVGGGILVVPILSFFFSLPVSAAVGTASAYAALTKVFAGIEHARIRNINYALAGKSLPGRCRRPPSPRFRSTLCSSGRRMAGRRFRSFCVSP